MIFLDTWVWCEYAFRDGAWEDAENAIRTAREEGGVVASTVLAEVSYAIRRADGEETAARTVEAIRGFDEIRVVPVTGDVALEGARLRNEYYERGECEPSYADAIHLATALMTDCDALYSGDSDFEPVEEIETVILGS